MDKLKFTIAASPFMDHSVLGDKKFIDCVIAQKPHIFDINFTVRAEPFLDDAHGIQASPSQLERHLDKLIMFQEKTGITMSALFNNIYVPPTQENLELFISSFRPFYHRGIRSMTLPHSLWLHSGRIHSAFPDVFIKNTVLRRTRSAQDFFNFAEAGFDYVNIDRLLWRDLNALKQIKKAQLVFHNETGKYVFTSMLIGEGCQGDCPFWEEHYQHNVAISSKARTTENNKRHFNTERKLPRKITKCSENISVFSRTLPTPFFSDFQRLTKNVDIIKLAGRHDANVLQKHMSFIEQFHSSSETKTNSAISSYYRPFDFNMIEDEDVHQWKKAIMNCGFQCWHCTVCEDTQLDILKTYPLF